MKQITFVKDAQSGVEHSLLIHDDSSVVAIGLSKSGERWAKWADTNVSDYKSAIDSLSLNFVSESGGVLTTQRVEELSSKFVGENLKRLNAATDTVVMVEKKFDGARSRHFVNRQILTKSAERSPSVTRRRLSSFTPEQRHAIVQYKATRFYTEQKLNTLDLEVKRVRAVFDRNIGPGGGWRCPDGTMYGGRITDRFGRGCGGSLTRRIGRAIMNAGRQMDDTIPDTNRTLDRAARRGARQGRRRAAREARRTRRQERVQQDIAEIREYSQALTDILVGDYTPATEDSEARGGVAPYEQRINDALLDARTGRSLTERIRRRRRGGTAAPDTESRPSGREAPERPRIPTRDTEAEREKVRKRYRITDTGELIEVDDDEEGPDIVELDYDFDPDYVPENLQGPAIPAPTSEDVVDEPEAPDAPEADTSRPRIPAQGGRSRRRGAPARPVERDNRSGRRREVRRDDDEPGPSAGEDFQSQLDNVSDEALISEIEATEDTLLRPDEYTPELVNVANERYRYLIGEARRRGLLDRNLQLVRRDQDPDRPRLEAGRRGDRRIREMVGEQAERPRALSQRVRDAIRRRADDLVGDYEPAADGRPARGGRRRLRTGSQPERAEELADRIEQTAEEMLRTPDGRSRGVRRSENRRDRRRRTTIPLRNMPRDEDGDTRETPVEDRELLERIERAIRQSLDLGDKDPDAAPEDANRDREIEEEAEDLAREILNDASDTPVEGALPPPRFGERRQDGPDTPEEVSRTRRQMPGVRPPRDRRRRETPEAAPAEDPSLILGGRNVLRPMVTEDLSELSDDQLRDELDLLEQMDFSLQSQAMQTRAAANIIHLRNERERRKAPDDTPDVDAEAKARLRQAVEQVPREFAPWAADSGWPEAVDNALPELPLWRDTTRNPPVFGRDYWERRFGQFYEGDDVRAPLNADGRRVNEMIGDIDTERRKKLRKARENLIRRPDAAPVEDLDGMPERVRALDIMQEIRPRDIEDFTLEELNALDRRLTQANDRRLGPSLQTVREARRQRSDSLKARETSPEKLQEIENFANSPTDPPRRARRGGISLGQTGNNDSELADWYNTHHNELNDVVRTIDLDDNQFRLNRDDPRELRRLLAEYDRDQSDLEDFPDDLRDAYARLRKERIWGRLDELDKEEADAERGRAELAESPEDPRLPDDPTDVEMYDTLDNVFSSGDAQLIQAYLDTRMPSGARMPSGRRWLDSRKAALHRWLDDDALTTDELIGVIRGLRETERRRIPQRGEDRPIIPRLEFERELRSALLEFLSEDELEALLAIDPDEERLELDANLDRMRATYRNQKYWAQQLLQYARGGALPQYTRSVREGEVDSNPLNLRTREGYDVRMNRVMQNAWGVPDYDAWRERTYRERRSWQDLQDAVLRVKDRLELDGRDRNDLSQATYAERRDIARALRNLGQTLQPDLVHMREQHFDGEIASLREDYLEQLRTLPPGQDVLREVFEKLFGVEDDEDVTDVIGFASLPDWEVRDERVEAGTLRQLADNVERNLGDNDLIQQLYAYKWNGRLPSGDSVATDGQPMGRRLGSIRQWHTVAREMMVRYAAADGEEKQRLREIWRVDEGDERPEALGIRLQQAYESSLRRASRGFDTSESTPYLDESNAPEVPEAPAAPELDPEVVQRFDDVLASALERRRLDAAAFNTSADYDGGDLPWENTARNALRRNQIEELTDASDDLDYARMQELESEMEESFREVFEFEFTDKQGIQWRSKVDRTAHGVGAMTFYGSIQYKDEQGVWRSTGNFTRRLSTGRGTEPAYLYNSVLAVDMMDFRTGERVKRDKYDVIDENGRRRPSYIVFYTSGFRGSDEAREEALRLSEDRDNRMKIWELQDGNRVYIAGTGAVLSLVPEDHPTSRNSGFANAFNLRLWNFMQAANVDHASVSAGLSDGRYHWGRTGYRSTYISTVSDIWDTALEQVEYFRSGDRSIVQTEEQAQIIEALAERATKAVQNAAPLDAPQFMELIYALEFGDRSDSRRDEVKSFMLSNLPFESGQYQFDDRVMISGRTDGQKIASAKRANPTPTDIWPEPTPRFRVNGGREVAPRNPADGRIYQAGPNQTSTPRTIVNPNIPDVDTAIEHVRAGGDLSEVPNEFWGQVLEANSSTMANDPNSRFFRNHNFVEGAMSAVLMYQFRDANGDATPQGYVIKHSRGGTIFETHPVDDVGSEVLAANIMAALGLHPDGAGWDGVFESEGQRRRGAVLPNSMNIAGPGQVAVPRSPSEPGGNFWARDALQVPGTQPHSSRLNALLAKWLLQQFDAGSNNEMGHVVAEKRPDGSLGDSVAFIDYPIDFGRRFVPDDWRRAGLDPDDPDFSDAGYPITGTNLGGDGLGPKTTLGWYVNNAGFWNQSALPGDLRDAYEGIRDSEGQEAADRFRREVMAEVDELLEKARILAQASEDEWRRMAFGNLGPDDWGGDGPAVPEPFTDFDDWLRRMLSTRDLFQQQVSVLDEVRNEIMGWFTGGRSVNAPRFYPDAM